MRARVWRHSMNQGYQVSTIASPSAVVLSGKSLDVSVVLITITTL